jgi:hypothetical protein
MLSGLGYCANRVIRNASGHRFERGMGTEAYAAESDPPVATGVCLNSFSKRRRFTPSPLSWMSA